MHVKNYHSFAIYTQLFALLLAAACATAAEPPSLRRDVDFILKYAPPEDAPLPAEYVTNNCVLAAAARDGAIEKYPDEIYLDYVLPYSVIREGRDDWRGEFRERFLPLVEGCTNAYDAAVKLDRTIWDMIGVHYDTRRDKARQSPRHSMRIGMASCTGISIILIDACRAVGIPARLVGCCWSTIPGNHSWVEVWSQGRWRVLASGEKEREDDIWFLALAAEADITRIDRRIYASRWSPSPDGTRFWQTWEHPQRLSDVPADDVTSRYVAPVRYAIVSSPETLAIPEWRTAADALAAKHAGEAEVEIVAAKPTDSLPRLRAFRPRYAAFLMRPGEFGTETLVELKRMMRRIDDDPFDDAIWGVVTGPDAATAMRIASSSSPRTVASVLATTGVDANVATGRVTVISDAYPKGEWWAKDANGAVVRHSEPGSLSHVFAEAWREIDPELILTSSHATEHNLEMPFSLGNVVTLRGGFATTAEVNRGGSATPLAAPRREKVWLAPGNCLIANHVDSGDMVMTALSFGRVNQFAGYLKPTWFGFAGWNSWKYFGALGSSLAAGHYAACQWLNLKLSRGKFADEREKQGLLWDRDATVFYGDPMHRVYTASAAGTYPADGAGAPFLVVFPYSSQKRRIEKMPDSLRVTEADDFALIEPAGKP